MRASKPAAASDVARRAALVAGLVGSIASAGVFAACGSSVDGAGPVALPAVDEGGAAADDAGPPVEAGAVSDAAPGPEADAGSRLPSTCEGPCRSTNVAILVDGRTGRVSRAQFGLTAAEKSGTGRPELHVELHEGGDPACPTERSPTPERTVVISGLPLASAPATYTMAEGVRLTLLDFGNELTDEPLLRATDVTLTPTAQSVDVAWAGDGGAPSDFVAFEVRAALPGGSLVGRVYAERCASLDLR